MLKYDISPNLEPEANERGDSHIESLCSEEIEAILAHCKCPWKRLKKTFQVEEGSPLIKMLKEQLGSSSGLKPEDPFNKAMKE